MDRELAKVALEIAVFLIVFAVCLLGVPIMMSILICRALGISDSDPRTIVIAILVTLAWFFAFACYNRDETESVIEQCKACCTCSALGSPPH